MLKTTLANILLWMKSTQKSKVFLIFYTVFVVVGVLLGFINIFVPAFSTCIPLFGNKVCSPFGEFVIIFANAPGYVLGALLLSPFQKIPPFLSMLMVGGLSLLVYFGLGYGIDSLSRKEKKQISLKQFITVIAVGGFALLFIFFVGLLLRMR